MDNSFLYELATLLGTSVSNLSLDSLEKYRKKFPMSPESYDLACESIAKLALENAVTILNKQ